MTQLRYFARGLWVDRHLSQWVTTIMIVINVGLGSVILAGGVDRFAPPSYNPLIDFTHGQTWIWGVWILISGLMIATPFKWTSIVGLWLGLVWQIIWMACFIVAVVNFPGAASTPIPVYAGLALLSTALLTARVIETNGG